MSELAGSIRRSLWAIRDHYEASLDGPRRGGNVGGGSGTREAPPPISLHILDARRDAHMDLAHYARVIFGEVTDINGGTIQTRITDDEQQQPLALAEFIDTWAERLEALVPLEALAADEDFARHAEQLRRLALPDRRDWMPIGPCPVTVADAEGNSVACGTQVRAYPDRQFIACPACGTEDTLAWWMSQIVPEASSLAPAAAVIAAVAMAEHRIIDGNLLRQWAHLGHIQRHGKDLKGRTLYSVSAVLAYVQHQTKEEVA